MAAVSGDNVHSIYDMQTLRPTNGGSGQRFVQQSAGDVLAGQSVSSNMRECLTDCDNNPSLMSVYAICPYELKQRMLTSWCRFSIFHIYRRETKEWRYVDSAPGLFFNIKLFLKSEITWPMRGTGVPEGGGATKT